MKKKARLLLSLLMAALLLTALPGVAFAADYNLTVGVSCDYCIEQRTDPGQITGVSIVSGSCPGLIIYVNAEKTGAYIGGTPTEAGDFSMSVSVTHADGDPYNTTLNFHVAAPAAPSPSPSPSPDVPVEPETTPPQEILVEETVPPKLEITKDPTGETKVEGGSATFIARANGATEIIWLLISGDGKTTYRCSDAPSHFPGLQVSGLGTDTLVLSNLPLSISGWQVQAMFNGEGGPLYSKKATLTVNRAELSAPTITGQPKATEVESGTPVTLYVTAGAPEGEVRYQWYKSSNNRNTGGQAIVGASGSSYSPAEISGTTYYYVTVWAVSGDRSSSSVSSAAAGVTFRAPEPAPEPSVEPASEPEPSVEPTPEEPPAEPAVPAPTPTPEEPPACRSGSAALIVAAVLLLLGAAASVVVYIILRRRDREAGDDYDD